MDDDEHLGPDESEYTPVDHTAQRLALLPLEEAHDLLRLLLTVAQQEGPMSPEADRLAKEIAARIPSEN
ncbi:DUF6417 family protein [Streptomyces sp. NBC_01635]|uniref:DUF6417 family protein n=1 Tax=Streptomyces sp. NBC_01635 TaxID=2975904 RepID=UPI003868DE5A|nr:DUF6417 family protein [Streptomyces sp. NBC_01635]